MTKTDSTSVDGASSTTLPVNHLARLEDQLNQLLACHEFYDLAIRAIRAITSPDYDEELDGKQWHFGLFLQQQWLQDQGQAVVTELQAIRRVFNE